MKNNLYDTLAEKWIRPGGTIWIYSDPHFADEEMIHLRKNYIGDKEQVKAINSKVGKNDTIIFLGDIGDVNFIKRIKGYKVLIIGNHDKGASNYKRVKHLKSSSNYTDEEVKKWKEENNVPEGIPLLPPDYVKVSSILPDYEDNHLFDEVYEGPLMVNDRLILSHEPIEQLPKYMFNIHGHDHSKWFNSPQHLNVCAENISYTPVNLLNLLKTGLLKNIDSIHRCCIDKATKDKRKKELRKIDKQLKELYNK